MFAEVVAQCRLVVATGLTNVGVYMQNDDDAIREMFSAIGRVDGVSHLVRKVSL